MSSSSESKLYDFNPKHTHEILSRAISSSITSFPSAKALFFDSNISNQGRGIHTSCDILQGFPRQAFYYEPLKPSGPDFRARRINSKEKQFEQGRTSSLSLRDPKSTHT